MICSLSQTWKLYLNAEHKETAEFPCPISLSQKTSFFQPHNSTVCCAMLNTIGDYY